MKDFFTFYTNISSMTLPFVAFRFAHVFLVLCGFIAIGLLMRKYNKIATVKQRKFQRGVAMFFLVEEVVYTIWIVSVGPENIWAHALPLELCSICAYMNVITLICKNDQVRFFSGFVGGIAGSIAVLYPANISGVYPVLSYRTINFFLLHLALILFACMQLKDIRLLQYKYLKKNVVILSCMIVIVFIINLNLHTQYMLVGMPPTNVIVNALYQITGIMFFLPVVCIAVSFIQVVVLFCLRIIYKVKKQEVLMKDVVYE